MKIEHHVIGRVVAAVVALSLAGAAHSQAAQPSAPQAGQPAQAQPGPPDPEAMRRAQEEADRIPTMQGDGPYPAVVGTDPTLPNHVIYRPADLAPFAGRGMPVLVWGNGGCSDDGTSARHHLAQIASYGYLVIAAGDWRSGPGAPLQRTPQRPRTASGQLPTPATTAADVRAGIDWAVRENGREGSGYRGLVDAGKIAVAGHSCGGLQAIELGTDPRVSTVLVHNSGVFNSGASSIAGINLTKDALRSLHTPIIYILGGPSDVAYPNGTDDFARIEHVPAVLADLPVGHGGTFSQPLGGAVAHVAVDWLEWQLRGDRVAARTFVGENCRLCTGTDWTIQTKNFRP